MRADSYFASSRLDRYVEDLSEVRTMPGARRVSARRVGRVTREDFSTSSFTATRHVVDERPINIGATEADGIEEGIGIRDKVLFVGEFIGDDLGVAGLAQHHQPTRYTYSFSSRAPSHNLSYTDPFCLASQKSSASRSIPHTAHS